MKGEKVGDLVKGNICGNREHIEGRDLGKTVLLPKTRRNMDGCVYPENQSQADKGKTK